MPPFGGIIMVVSSVTETDYSRLVRTLIPFIILELLVLLLVVLIPDISLALPSYLGLMD